VSDKDEGRLVADSRCEVQGAVAEKTVQKSSRDEPDSDDPPPQSDGATEVDEPVHILLVIVGDSCAGIERHGEARARSVYIEVDHVAVRRKVLNFPEAEDVFAMIVEVLHGFAGRVEHDRLAPHVRHLTRPEKNSPTLSALVLKFRLWPFVLNEPSYPAASR